MTKATIEKNNKITLRSMRQRAQKLTKTACCGNWICDDEGNYVIFSTLETVVPETIDDLLPVPHHHEEKHKGDWTTCKECG